MEYVCNLHEQAPQPTLSVRTRASAQDLPGAMGAAYGAIARYLGELGIGTNYGIQKFTKNMLQIIHKSRKPWWQCNRFRYNCSEIRDFHCR